LPVSMRTRSRREIPNILLIKHHQIFLICNMPPLESADFTTTRSGSVICQRCKMSYPEGTKLRFLHDVTGQGPGRNICEGCHQYYVTKTQMAEEPPTARKLLINRLASLYLQIPAPGQPSYSRQVTPGHQLTTAVAQQHIRKAVAAAQREGRTL
jgi:hypothetical protein